MHRLSPEDLFGSNGAPRRDALRRRGQGDSQQGKGEEEKIGNDGTGSRREASKVQYSSNLFFQNVLIFHFCMRLMHKIPSPFVQETPSKTQLPHHANEGNQISLRRSETE